MSSSNKCNEFFESAAQSTIMTSIPSICLLILGVFILVLSVQQADPIMPKTFDKVETQAWTDACDNDIIEFLSPFCLETSFDTVIGCQWRSRNITFRVIVAALAILASIVELIVLCSGKLAKAWPALYWINWITFVMMFVVFVLDCDSINTGYNSCLHGFEIEESSIIAIEIEHCYLTPFIWTALADLAVSIIAFCGYNISKYYTFNPYKVSFKNKSNVDDNDVTNDDIQPVAQLTTGNIQKDDSPDPFAEYQGGYEVEDGNKRKKTSTSAYGGRLSAYDE